MRKSSTGDVFHSMFRHDKLEAIELLDYNNTSINLVTLTAPAGSTEAQRHLAYHAKFNHNSSKYFENE
jgi:hypothetical protein